jgi:hypothetical protein
VVAYRKALTMVGRTANRVVVGLPLCTSLFDGPNSGRNKEYLISVALHAVHVYELSRHLSLCPRFIRPYLLNFYYYLSDLFPFSIRT